MSDSEDDFASADEGEVDTAAKKESPKDTDPKEAAVDSSKDAKPDKPAQASGDAAKTAGGGGGKKGAGKGKAQQKKKGGASGKQAESKTDNKPSEKAAESKQGPKDGDKSSGNVTKSKAQKRNDKSKKNSQKVSSNTEKESGQVKADSEVTQSPQTSEDKVEDNKRTESPETGESKPEVKEETTDIVTSTVPETSPDSENTVIKTPDTTNSQTPVKQSESPESVSSGADPATLIKSPSSQNIVRPGPDHTSDQENVLSKLAEAATEKKSGGWGWGGWGSSLLDVASSSVSTFTSQVGEGFNTMMETVESSLNVPDPEQMAEKNAKAPQGPGESTDDEASDQASDNSEEKEKSSAATGTSDSSTKTSTTTAAENQSASKDGDDWFSGWGVSNITKMVENTTKMVENTSKTLVTGSLDVLETIGKKTFDVLNEHDPGLKRTRGLVKIDKGDKPNLSAALRDAKTQYEAQVEQEKETEEARKSHFGALFDDFQGLSHLEALEMLSNQSEKQVNTLLGSLSPDQLTQLKPQLLQIKQHFEIDEDEAEDGESEDQDFVKLVTEVLTDLSIPSSPNKLIKIQEKINDSLEKSQQTEEGESSAQPKVLHQTAIQSLAEFTSKSIEHFHKFGELVLIHKADVTDFVPTSKQLHSMLLCLLEEHFNKFGELVLINKADVTDFVPTSKQMHSLTKILCAEVSIISTKFTEALNKLEGGAEALSINQFVTNIYLEASNSCSYIQDGFQLLLPVMQQATVEHSQTGDQS